MVVVAFNPPIEIAEHLDQFDRNFYAASAEEVLNALVEPFKCRPFWWRIINMPTVYLFFQLFASFRPSWDSSAGCRTLNDWRREWSGRESSPGTCIPCLVWTLPNVAVLLSLSYPTANNRKA